MPPEAARRHPWLGAALSSGAFDKQVDALETLLSFESVTTTATLRKLAMDRAADARVRRVAAIGLAIYGVKIQEPERSAAEPLSTEDLTSLGASPDLALIQRAALVLAAGELPARMKSLAALNDLAGGGLCRMELASADVPSGIAEMVLKEALCKWKDWWVENATRWGGEAAAPTPPMPINSTDILVAAMLEDPGEVTSDDEGRVIQEEIAGAETFEYDTRGRLKGMRTQGPLVFR